MNFFFYRTFCLILCVAILGTANGQSKDDAAADQPKVIAMNGETIVIPSPSSLVRSANHLPTFKKRMAESTQRNDVHEVYAPKGATESSFQKSGLKRNADFQTLKKSPKLDQKTFEVVKKYIKANFDKMVQKTVARLSSEDKLAVKVRDKIGTGVFLNTNEFYSYLYFTAVDQDDKTIQRVSSASIVKVKNNLIYLYVHSNLRSEDDATWVKKQTENWIKSIVAKNKT